MVILIKYSTNCSCNNCVINIGKKWTLQILIPQYQALLSNKLVLDLQGITVKRKTINCFEGKYVMGPKKLKNCSARPMITFVLQGRQKKAALTEHQKCTKLLVEMTSSMMHIFVFLQKNLSYLNQDTFEFHFLSFLPKFV